jgi:hypothetical protein
VSEEPEKAVRARGNAVIRQAISCDICGAEKKQTNHWFVAHENAGELRVSGWNTRNRMRPGSKHLCGQTCLHKLVDDFMARDLAVRVQRSAAGECEVEELAESVDASLTSDSSYVEPKSSARPIASPAPYLPSTRPFKTPVPTDTNSAVGWKGGVSADVTSPIPYRSGVELVAVPARVQATASIPVLPESTPGSRPRNLRAEAWDRERQRELRAANSRPDTMARRRSAS